MCNAHREIQNICFPHVCGQDGRAKGLSASRGGGPGQGGVSVWRQLLVANEWNRLGTRRRVNPACSLVWMAFVLGAGRLRYNATPQPDLADTEASKGMRLCLPTLLFSRSRGRAIGGASSVVAHGRACANSAHTSSSESFRRITTTIPILSRDDMRITSTAEKPTDILRWVIKFHWLASFVAKHQLFTLPYGKKRNENRPHGTYLVTSGRTHSGTRKGCQK